MADPTCIVVPANAVNVVIGSPPGQRITDFPATGTYLSITRGQPLATATAGLNTLTFSKNKTKFYNVAITVTQHHKDDRFLTGAILAQEDTNLIQAVSVEYLGQIYTSVQAYILEEPVRELAADASANVTYTFGCWFQQIIVGAFAQPEALSADQINSYLS
jgi:hypothetical protein